MLQYKRHKIRYSSRTRYHKGDVIKSLGNSAPCESHTRWRINAKTGEKHMHACGNVIKIVSLTYHNISLNLMMKSRNKFV